MFGTKVRDMEFADVSGVLTFRILEGDPSLHWGILRVPLLTSVWMETVTSSACTTMTGKRAKRVETVNFMLNLYWSMLFTVKSDQVVY